MKLMLNEQAVMGHGDATEACILYTGNSIWSRLSFHPQIDSRVHDAREEDLIPSFARPFADERHRDQEVLSSLQARTVEYGSLTIALPRS